MCASPNEDPTTMTNGGGPEHDWHSDTKGGGGVIYHKSHLVFIIPRYSLHLYSDENVPQRAGTSAYSNLKGRASQMGSSCGPGRTQNLPLAYVSWRKPGLLSSPWHQCPKGPCSVSRLSGPNRGSRGPASGRGRLGSNSGREWLGVVCFIEGSWRGAFGPLVCRCPSSVGGHGLPCLQHPLLGLKPLCRVFLAARAAEATLVHSLQRWPSSRQLKQQPNRASAESAAWTMPMWNPWSIQWLRSGSSCWSSWSYSSSGSAPKCTGCLV